MAYRKEDIGTDLGRVSRMWRACVDERLAPLGLSMSRWLAVWYLAKAGGALPQRELAIRLGIEGPTLVRTLDWLEGQSMIERRDDPADRRNKIVHLLPTADQLVETIARIGSEFREQVFQGFSPHELEALHQMLARMAHNMGGELPSERSGQ